MSFDAPSMESFSYTFQHLTVGGAATSSQAPADTGSQSKDVPVPQKKTKMYEPIKNIQPPTDAQQSEFDFHEKVSHFPNHDGKRGGRGSTWNSYSNPSVTFVDLLREDKVDAFEVIQNCNGYSAYLRCFFQLKDTPGFHEVVPLEKPDIKFFHRGSTLGMFGDPDLLRLLDEKFTAVGMAFRVHFTRNLRLPSASSTNVAAQEEGTASDLTARGASSDAAGSADAGVDADAEAVAREPPADSASVM